MKKIFTFIAVTLLATCAFAQITLVHSFEGQIYPLGAYGLSEGVTSYLLVSTIENSTITIYNSNFSVYKTINISAPNGYSYNGYSAACYDIFADKKIGFFVSFQNQSYAGTNDYKKSMIIDEDGNVLIDLGNSQGTVPALFYMNNIWYMLCWKLGWNEAHTTISYYQTDIYSLPGKGEMEDIGEVSAPRRNAHKFIRSNQVLIDSNNRIYNLLGQELK